MGRRILLSSSWGFASDSQRLSYGIITELVGLLKKNWTAGSAVEIRREQKLFDF
jgi:hypothetical protein